MNDLQSTDKPTEHKVALVTGAAQRIGAEICRHLHHSQFNIIIHYRASKESAESLATELNTIRNNSATCIQADLSNSAEVKSLATATLKVWGHIDALINNASSFYPTPMATASEEDWGTLIDSNLKGPFFLSQALSCHLAEQQGCIVNIVDIHSRKPMSKHSIYCIAKAGVEMMTKTLAKELAPNVRVNGVSPGAILWPDVEMDEKTQQSILNRIPIQNTGATSDISKTVNFLVVDAPYISGQIIAVDGGRSLNM